MNIPLAVVTGGSGGIGREIAARLGQDGYAVVVHYSSRKSAADDVVDAIHRDAGSAWSVQADLSEPSGVDALADAVFRLLDAQSELALHALVNNASLMLGPGFGAVTPAAFDNYLSLNVRAPLLLTQALSPRMRRGGSVVNISSAAAHFASPGDLIYAMSKNAIEAFTRHAAVDLAKDGVRINNVVPGFTDNGHPAFKDTDVRAHMASFAAMGDVSAPAHVADAVAFLVSDHASRTTGTSVDVSGGSTIGARTSNSASLSLKQVAQRY